MATCHMCQMKRVEYEGQLCSDCREYAHEHMHPDDILDERVHFGYSDTSLDDDDY